MAAIATGRDHLKTPTDIIMLVYSREGLHLLQSAVANLLLFVEARWGA